MGDRATDIRWGVEQRLEFIEFRLFWEGGVNRSDIVDTFGVSVPQASKDLSLYQELAPENAAYDKRGKRYVPTAAFKPRFMSSDPDTYLLRLRSVAEGLVDPGQSWIAQLPDVDVATTPRREVDLTALRAVLSVLRKGSSLEVRYQSMNKLRPDPVWRRISPHALGFDGLRWHTRAFCHLEGTFKDFLLPRILETRNVGPAGARPEKDNLWREFFQIEIAPHPGLTPSQQQVVARDYGFNDGKGVISVRYAMLFYVLKRLGLLSNPEKEDPRRQHIVAINKSAVQTALEYSNYFETSAPALSGND